MKRLVLGILAHVDAGKTTLSEALLYTAGAIPALGRVDHRDAHLDTHALERARGITIFSKQALFETEQLSVTLLDTPGHVDFSAEMERTLQVLDYAILVISATDGVQAHTETLWRLLRRRQIPTFVFLTKMDLPNPGRAALMAQLRKHLDEGCLDFTEQNEDWLEAIAMREDALLDQYLDTGKVDPRDISGLIRLGKLFPCFFGSALHLDGVTEFLQGLAAYTEAPTYGEDFAARVFKIARDPQGNRLTYVKLTGGTLHVRDPIAYYPLHGEEIVEEKVTQLRLYSGEKFQTVSAVQAGQVCALLGLSQTWPSQGFGTEPPAPAPLLEPVVTYRLVLPPDCDPQLLLPKLRLLEEEDPQLHLDWDAENREIHARLMGQVQIEVLKQLIAERFQVEVAVDAMKDYPLTVVAYTRGRGKFACSLHGYAPCHNQKQVVAAANYDPEADLPNTPDSVFCAHGAGFNVKWNEVPQYMHLESCLAAPKSSDDAPLRPRVVTRNLDIDDKELEAIFEKAFGPIRHREEQFRSPLAPSTPQRVIAPPKQQYLIVDGYNMIFAWDELKALAKEDLDAARQRLMDTLANYASYKQCRLVLVFDGYKVKGNRGTTFDYHSIQVVFTKENETGDMYIEKLIQEIGRNFAVRVATSDGLIQLSALRAGVLRVTAGELLHEVEFVLEQMARAIEAWNKKGSTHPQRDKRTKP